MQSHETTHLSEATSTQHNASNAAFGALAVAGAGALALGALSAKPAMAIEPVLEFEKDIPGTGDVKVLNYALALEDLETEAYVQALQRLTTGGSGGRDAAPGTAITGLGLSRSERDVQFFTTFGRVERQHRDFIRGALGNAALTPFKFNFGIASMTRIQVVTLIYRLEQAGVGAYLGAIPSFATKQYLPAAAAILGTEARHASILANILNTQSGREAVGVAPLANNRSGRDLPIEPNTILSTVSPFIVAPAA